MQGLHRDKHIPADVSCAARQVEMDDNVAAAGAGGALAVVVATDVFNVSGCAFSGNSAKTDGGALSLTSFAANSTTTIARTDFRVTRQTEISSAVLREEASRDQFLLGFARHMPIGSSGRSILQSCSTRLGSCNALHLHLRGSSSPARTGQ